MPSSDLVLVLFLSSYRPDPVLVLLVVSSSLPSFEVSTVSDGPDAFGHRSNVVLPQ